MSEIRIELGYSVTPDTEYHAVSHMLAHPGHLVVVAHWGGAELDRSEGIT
jgi:hypothetical protein